MKRGTLLQIGTLIFLIWICFFVHSCSSGEPYSKVPTIREITRPPFIQVGFSTSIREKDAKFRVNGPCRIGIENFDQGGEFLVEATEHGLRIGELEFDTDLIRVQVIEDGTLEVWVKDSRKKKWIYRACHGHLLIYRERKEGKPRVTLVNEVDLENYVAGVVGREMSLRKGVEALKAQIIAARTYAMCEVKNGRVRKGEQFDLYDDTRSQAYAGMQNENELARKLVQETRGMFVVWEKNLVNTFYSSTCGGRTDSAWDILREGRNIPPLEGTECGYCEESPLYRWEARFDRKKIAEILFPDEPNLKVESVRIVDHLPGGHVTEVGVKLVGHEKERFLNGNTEFRRRLRKKVKSAAFIGFEVDKNEIVIKGKGFGHGAGMCQYGAYGMAKKGFTGIQILEHYFPGAEVKKLY